MSSEPILVCKSRKPLIALPIAICTAFVVLAICANFSSSLADDLTPVAAMGLIAALPGVLYLLIWLNVKPSSTRIG